MAPITTTKERTMVTYEIDTNAGPILTKEFTNATAAKRYMESMIPYLRKRGYTSAWYRVGAWHVISIKDTKGRKVHAAAFRAVA